MARFLGKIGIVVTALYLGYRVVYERRVALETSRRIHQFKAQYLDDAVGSEPQVETEGDRVAEPVPDVVEFDKDGDDAK